MVFLTLPGETRCEMTDPPYPAHCQNRTENVCSVYRFVVGGGACYLRACNLRISSISSSSSSSSSISTTSTRGKGTRFSANTGFIVGDRVERLSDIYSRLFVSVFLCLVALSGSLV